MLRIIVLYLILVVCFSYVSEHKFGMFFAQYCALNKSQYLPTQHCRHLYFVSDMGKRKLAGVTGLVTVLILFVARRPKNVTDRSAFVTDKFIFCY